MTKNLSSLLPPAPAQRLRRPTWPIPGGALLFSSLGRQVRSHPAPRGAWCAPRGVVGPPEPAIRGTRRLCGSRGPLAPSSPQSWSKVPLHPQLKNKTHQAHSRLRSLDNPMLSHSTPVKSTRRPPPRHTHSGSSALHPSTDIGCRRPHHTHNSTSHTHTHTHTHTVHPDTNL